MRVVVAGGTGFIGKSLCYRLLQKGHTPVALGRSCDRVQGNLGEGVECLQWDGVSPVLLAEYLNAHAGEELGIVNLAGENIGAGRWSADVRKRILDSRINATKCIASAIEITPAKPSVLVQGSAVGFYGASASANNKVLDVEDPVGDGYLASVCGQWEQASEAVLEHGVRRVVARTGLVLGQGGGVLEKFLPPFRLFAGGPLGGGEQWMSWIHMADMVGALVWLLENSHAKGVYNLTAPKPVTMVSFCRELGKVLGRPSWLPVPAAVLTLLLGEMAGETVLASQRAVPFRLIDAGYNFQFTDLQEALQDILGSG